MSSFRLTAGLVALAVLAASAPAHAQSPADFYKGKTIEVYIGTSVGGGYDAYTRILSRHMGKYIPGNPVLVPKNMAGGGGIRLANFLYNAAPKDGLVFGTINRGIPSSRCSATRPRSSTPPAFNWIGSTNDEVSDLRRLAHDRRRALPAGAGARAGGRRVGHRRRHLSVPQGRERRPRNEIQGRHRLSRRQ